MTKGTKLIALALALTMIGAIRAEIQNSIRFMISAPSESVVFRMDAQTGEVCKLSVTADTIQVVACGGGKDR